MNDSFFSSLIDSCNSANKCRVVVPLANDEACAYAISQGVKSGLIKATLIGEIEKIKDIYGALSVHDSVNIINEADERAACLRAVQEVRDGNADIVMKGLVATSSILKAVLDSKTGLRKNPILSHLTFFELPEQKGVKILTDVAIIIAPDEETIKKIIYNAVEAFGLVSSKIPKVAILAANEKVSDKMPSTVVAQKVAQSLKDEPNMIVEGPLSLDLASSKESALIKKYDGKIQGDADIFVVPRIETGNVFYKSLQYFVKANMGGVVYGAKCPVVLTSRADNNDTKFNSLLLGVTLWNSSHPTLEKSAQN